MSANIVATEKVMIDPINAPPDGEYSFKNGYPIIQFLVAQSDKYLVGKSLRLTGEIEINNAAGDLPNNNAGVGGANGATRRNASIDRVVGVASAIHQVTLSTLDNQTLEMVKQYPRLLASLVSGTHGATDLTNGNSTTQLVNSRDVVQACSMNTQRSFSIPIRCGLLSGTGLIPLGQNGTRGMIVQMECAPDSSVLEPFILASANDPDSEALTSGTAGNNSIADFSYKLKNLSLTYDLLVPDEEGAQMMNNASQGALVYNAYSNLYSVINSSDQTVTLNLGASKVQSVIHNIIPTTKINNSQEQSNALYKLQNGADEADIKEVAYAKAGILFPRENRIDEKQPNAGANGETEIDCVTLQTYLNAIRNINDIDNTLASAYTETAKATRVNAIAQTPAAHADPNVLGQYEDRWGNTLTNYTNPIFGLGIRQDQFKHGVDYSRQPYSVRVTSDLDGNNPNSLYTYVLAENQLMYSPEGIRITS